MLRVQRIVTEEWRENCYVVSSADSRTVIIIDPGSAPAVINVCAEAKLTPAAILCTHAHFDHIAGVAALKEQLQIPFFLHPDDARLLRSANFYTHLFLGGEKIQIPEIDGSLVDGALLTFGALQVSVMHTPGHTKGSVCFSIEGELFSGDTVLPGGVSRTDLPGGDGEELRRSLRRIEKSYPREVLVYPGHGEAQPLGAMLSAIDL